MAYKPSHRAAYPHDGDSMKAYQLNGLAVDLEEILSRVRREDHDRIREMVPPDYMEISRRDEPILLVSCIDYEDGTRECSVCRRRHGREIEHASE